MTEEELISACKKRDPRAMKRLYELYSSKMLGVCNRYVNDRETARDLMHDGFCTLFEKIGDYRAEGSFEGWVRKIFVNMALGHLRKSLKEGYSDPVEEHYQLEDPEGSPLREMETEELLKCIRRLPVGYRTVLNLFAIEGYSHREIAQMLGINENTSRSQYSRAKSQLLKMLKQAQMI